MLELLHHIFSELITSNVQYVVITMEEWCGLNYD